MKLYLIASTALRSGASDFLSQNETNWTQTEGVSNAESVIEFSGRVCYMSFGKRQSPRNNSEYIGHLISQAHESVLEHATFSILAHQISRSLSQQITRHRVGFSFSQLSQQYFFDESPQHIVPADISKDPKAFKIWKNAVNVANQAYEKITNSLIDSKFAEGLPDRERLRAIRSAARAVLPNSTGTSIVITANLRAWRNFLHIRGSTEGDFEMTEFCVKIFNLLQSEAPSAFQDFQIQKSNGRELIVRNKNSRKNNE